LLKIPWSLWGLSRTGGLDVWARVHDLLPGRVCRSDLVQRQDFLNHEFAKGNSKPACLEGCYDAGFKQAGDANVKKTVRVTRTTESNYMVVSVHRAEYLDAGRCSCS